MMRPNRRSRARFAILVSIAVLTGFASAALSQTEEPRERLIAPRGLHPKLQREGKLARQRQDGLARTETVPSGLQSSKSPATDNLAIAIGFDGIGFPNSFGSVPPDTHVATGPEHIVEVTNTTIAFYGRLKGKRLFIHGGADFLPPPKGIKDKGCGAQKVDRTFGPPVVTDVVL